MSGGINYSKWDNLEENSDDEQAAAVPKTTAKAEDAMDEEEEEDSDDEDSDDEEEEEEEESDDEDEEELLKEKAEAKKAEGNTFFKKKDFVGAIRYYTQAINLYPTEVYYSNRAAAYISLKQWEKARSDADTCIRLNKTFTKGYLHRAKSLANVSCIYFVSLLDLNLTTFLLLQLGDFKQCTATIREGMDKCKDMESKKKFTNLAQEIQKIFSAHQSKSRGSPPGRSGGSSSSASPPKPPQPRAPPKPTGPVAPADDAPAEERAEFLKEQGNVQYKKGLYGTALDFYKKAVDTAPSIGKYYGNKAACETMLQKHWNAANTCKAGLKVEPGMVKLRTRLCTALVHQGKIDEALECLEENTQGLSAADQSTLSDKAAEVTKVQTQWAQAKGYLGEKQFGAALTSLKKLEKEVTASEQLSLLIAESCIGTRNFSEAGKITQTVISNNRNCIDAYVLRAEALYYLDGGGQRTEAQAVNHLQVSYLRMPLPVHFVFFAPLLFVFMPEWIATSCLF
jgi:tetratricopeptide (TPR) repeat protein